ncbi:hypothetical protein MHH60_29920 [Paenibacillus sp. FSL H7-0716]|uniref:Uncharacterized protein n=1 Tax=Paenibacillus odorifer TaxID=189426 RepID=A0AB36J4D9_9BACL|nr:hypothetical protein [Paenibacillus odorifer]OME11087.1 hypothetical protein BSK47_29715 [Paenibacillus odorifer]
MLNFDSIMNLARREATYNAAQRLSKKENNPLVENLEPELKELTEQNELTIILIEEIVKSGLKQYHKAVQDEEQRKSRTSF